AMVDASLGGKNALNLGNTKNVLGSFHFPSHMLCDVRWLRTLPRQDIASGMAEVIKHALLDSESQVRWLEQQSTLDESAYVSMIRRSQEVKLRFIGADPLDTGIRHALNYGHTFGHAIELVTGLPHGHAIAAGIGIINRFAVEKGFMNSQTAERIAALLRRYELPASLTEACARVPMCPPTAGIASLFAADKKIRSGILKLVILHEIGSFSIEPVPLDELVAFAGALA
ncbi:MAG: 3-dehydroquinate synthase, partial [Rectinema sp.]|nr:3-dehydroquinate synthase [Rectinema sp.]